MKQFKFRLDSFIRIEKEVLREALHQYAGLSSQLNDIRLLKQKMADEVQELTRDRSQPGMFAYQEAWIQRLNERKGDMEKLDGAIESFTKKVNDAHQAYIKQKGKVESLAKLRQKHLDRHEKHVRLEEDYEMGELFNARFAVN